MYAWRVDLILAQSNVDGSLMAYDINEAQQLAVTRDHATTISLVS